MLQQLPSGWKKKFFVPMTAGRCITRENRGIVARHVPNGGHRFLSEADQRVLIAPAKHADVVRQHLPARPADRPRRERRRVASSCWTKCSRTRRPRPSSSASGCGCTTSCAGWQSGAGSTSSSTAACPGPNRKHLVHRFREDPACRVFLATDAGGVGLNLQHASVVVNIDLPWNPAVLEQRIGRVHRLGQRRPVRVVNFIAQGTIEEGMLGLLKFKKSLFAGVLDGGEDEVFLGGTRLNRFMESVEKATGEIPASMPQEPDRNGAAPRRRGRHGHRRWPSAGGGRGGSPHRTVRRQGRRTIRGPARLKRYHLGRHVVLRLTAPAGSGSTAAACRPTSSPATKRPASPI